MANKIDDAFKSVYAPKTAQSVWNDLRELRQHFTDRRTRWIWELLQNASDASTSADNCLIAEIKYSPGQLVFLHNGRSFKASEVAHLIASGSTKYEDEEATGEFGTGFLTTHLLSLKIEVSGQLDRLLEDLRTDVTSDDGSGVRLVCEAGTTGIRVNKFVWEDDGFPLEKLAEHLK